MTRAAGRFGTVARAGAWLSGLAGWRRMLVAFVCGAVSALGFAPFALFPLLLLAYGGLVLLLDGAVAGPRPLRAAAGVGWAFGFGQFLAGLYWVGDAFTVDAAAHAWQIPFVELLLPGGLALFPLVACLVAAWLWRPGAARILVLAICLSIAAWLRGHVLTGFPWNLAAYGWAASLEVMQSAALFGAYGLTLLTILFGASLAELVQPRRRWALPGTMILLFALLWTGGVVRMALDDPQTVANVRIRIVQPNIPEAEKFDPQYQQRNWNRLVLPSMMPTNGRRTIIVWPESAPSFLLARSQQALKQVAQVTGTQNVLITGAARMSDQGERRFFNSLYIFGPGGIELGVYDKHHLVPFGEYLPMAPLMQALGIGKLVDSPGGFTPGEGAHTYALPGLPSVGPLICYEAIFPGAVVAAPRPGWMVNVTNDSWFGDGAGPKQHFLIARMRAIEEGLALVRAADTGISAVVDANGRIVAELGIDRMGTVDAALPAPLPPTPYARYGDWLFAIMLALCAAVAFWLNSRK